MARNNANLYGPPIETGSTARVEKDKMDKAQEGPKPDKKLISQYRREIERYRRSTTTWTEEGNDIEKLYLDEDRTQNANRRFALLWANVETLKPAVYARVPVVECSRRYKDRDPVARTAAELIERATNTTFELYNVDETFRMVRDDRLLSGRGQAWVRYEATIEQYEDEDAGAKLADELADTDQESEVQERLAGEKVCVDYVQWTEFGHNICGAWNDVWLVFRCIYKTREEVEERFGEEMAARLSYDAIVPTAMTDRVNGMTLGENADEFCKIVELWDKRRNKVSWMTESLPDEFLETGKPPISFSNFFPCPMPCYATKTSRSLIPRPDYIYYRDQAKEINDLTDKIGNLMEWLQVKAFVPGAPSGLADSIEEVMREKSNRALFIQVQSMTEWTERGGAKGLIDWLPIDMIIQAIQAAVSARNQLIQDVFQITGISDILRGQTDPGETLGAQELKAQTGSRRLKNSKDEIARFCRDTGRLVAEVISEKFQPQTIAEITGYRYVPALPMGGNVVAMPGAQVPGMVGASPADAMGGSNLPGAAPAQATQEAPMTFDDRVVELLRNDRLRSFRIDIETDSTGQADENADKQQAMEFMNTTGQFMDRAVVAMQTVPETADLMGEMLTFAVRRFRAGRTMEEQIEKTFVGLAAKAQAAAQQPPQPSPEQIKAQAEAQAMQQKAAIEQQKSDQEMLANQQKTQADLAVSQAQLAQINARTEQQAAEHLFKMAEMEQQAAINQNAAAAKQSADLARFAAQPEMRA